MPDSSSDPKKQVIFSFYQYRKIIGYLGILLPLILIFGTAILDSCTDLLPTISDYYYTVMRDVFVATLSVISLFLFTYPGYDNRDKISCKIAAVCMMGVALFPTYWNDTIICTREIAIYKHAPRLHFTFAATMFLSLSYISYFLFTLPRDKNKTHVKKQRDLIYKICGILIFFSTVFIGVYFQFIAPKYPWLEDFRPIIALEIIALVSFGVSWLIKGQALLADNNSDK